MTDMTVEVLFDSLLRATTPTEVRALLRRVGDHPDVDIGERFGELGLRWHPFNDSLSNISNIGLGTKSGRSLTERLTNAIDAVLESRASSTGNNPESCRIAANQWFGRPISGPDDGLFRWNYDGRGYDRLTQVLLLPGDSETAPAVDVLDQGIGLLPDAFPETILSLTRGNKLSKLHLIGAFGQGGAATLAFSDFTVVISRNKHSPSRVGFTVIRVLRLGNQYKEDAYAYLSIAPEGHPPRVPEVVRYGSLDLYDSSERSGKLPDLEAGTVVRHVGYKLHGLTGSLSPSSGNLYHYLHVSMFDPLLPFRVVDLRASDQARDELVTGNRNRLMRLVRQKEEGTEGRVEMRHYRPMEYVTPHGSEDASVGIEYWVPLAYRKAPKGKGEQVLRPASNELFATAGHPIIGTLNGQNQGELTAKLLRDVGLGMVAKHIVIHLDASSATSQVRRELFSTNREGFKEGDVLTGLSRMLQRILDEDEELHAIEQELTDRLTRRESEDTNKEVVEQITKLLLDAGLKVSKPGASHRPGGDDEQVGPSHKRPRYKQQQPLPTLPYPEVTAWRIVTPTPELQLRLNDDEIVLVETNADAQFDKDKRIAIRFDPPKSLEVSGKAPLRGGRVRWRLRPTAELAVGSRGTVVVSITKPDGSQLSDSVPYQILPGRDERTKKQKGLVPPFRVKPVSPEETEVWAAVWPELAGDVSDDAIRAVAYRPMAAGEETIVYYSTVFRPYSNQVEQLKKDPGGLASLFETSYAVWIGYHAILQHQAPDPKDVEDDVLAQIEEDDRKRVATMQVKQALQVAKLRQELLKAQSQAG